MKFLIALSCLFFLVEINSFSQDISSLEKMKEDIIKKIAKLNDSLNSVEEKLMLLKNEKFLEMVSDSSIKAEVLEGAKLKKSPDPNVKPFKTLEKGTKVIILDYSDNYFGVCIGNDCGFMSEVWVKNNPSVEFYVSAKKLEEKEYLRIENERLRNNKLEFENELKQKYGLNNFNRMKQGYYWIGMNKEMLTFSLGSPIKINRTVGSWGVNEQWVYPNNLYIYFENGKLTSFQD